MSTPRVTPRLTETETVRCEDAFDIGDDGVVVLLRATFPESDRARLETAARSCPAAALTVADA